jgi:hypothetical protein
MSALVEVLPQWRSALERVPRPGAVLEDEACEFVARRAGAVLTRAIRGVGTDAIFNRILIPQLLAELTTAAEETASAAVSRNLLEVVAFIEEHIPPASSLHDSYVFFLSD